MDLFTHTRPLDFNRDDVVLCHEVGHAVVWNFHGGKITGIRFWRAGDGHLNGEVSVENPNDLKNPIDAEHIVERFIAGDAAGRRRLGLRRDQISTVGVKVSREIHVPTLLISANVNDDAMRAIWAAYESVGPKRCDRLLVALGREPRWYAWLRIRLANVVNILDVQWTIIERAVEELVRHLPASGSEVRIPPNKVELLLDGSASSVGCRIGRSSI